MWTRVLGSLGLCLVLAGQAQAEERFALLVVHQEEGSVSFLDPISGRDLGTVKVGLGAHEVAISADGRLAVVTNYGTRQGGSSLSVIDVENQRLVRTIPLTIEQHEPSVGRVLHTFHRPHGVCFTKVPNQVLVACESESVVLLVNVETGTVLAAIETGQEVTSLVLLDRDGRRAFVSNERSGSITVIDVGRRRVIDVIETGGGARGMALHPLKDELWVTNFETNSISVVDTKTLKEVFEFPCGTYPVQLTFTHDGSRALCVNYQGGSISVFDGETRRLVREVGLKKLTPEEAEARPLDGAGQGRFGRTSLPTGMLLSPDGGTAWITCSRSNQLAELDVASLEVVRYLETGGHAPEGLAWSSFEDDVTSAK